MNKTDYMVLIAKNMYDMKQLKINYKYLYDKYNRQEMFKIARKISRYSPNRIKESFEKINDNKLFDNFLSSIELLDNNNIYKYYRNMLNRIEVKRSKNVLCDEAELEYYYDKKKSAEFYINLPTSSLIITNQIGFAHEMGHIPEIDLPRKSFLEYGEVLSIFFEYIMALKSYETNAKDNFLYERLSMTIDEATNLIKTFKKCEAKEKVQRMYFEHEFADAYKFLESCDYALQLIDLFEKDKSVVSKEIEKVIKGKSLIDVADDLSIDSTGCKRLLKEYKNEE